MIVMNIISSWGGRIRTLGCGDQNPVPYRLATPQKTIKEYLQRNLDLIIQLVVCNKQFHQKYKLIFDDF